MIVVRGLVALETGIEVLLDKVLLIYPNEMN